MEIQPLATLADSLKKTKDLGEKQELLLGFPRVAASLSDPALKPFLPPEHDLSSKIALYSVIAIEQHLILFAGLQPPPSKEKIKNLIAHLVAVERFYESIGGIVGYQVEILKLLEKNKGAQKPPKKLFSRAAGIDLAAASKEVSEAVWTGILASSELGEIYAIGGLGTRLKLVDKKLEPQPAACLPFAGRSLLEGLVRDVQAREFLFYRLFSRQVTIPVAMMTSLEKHHAIRVEAICAKKRWFGRPKESFLLFSQISVPVVTQEGKWSMKSPLEINLQPGGHGALWKAAEECGVFSWLKNQEKHHLLIRQINNPIAGLDIGLLGLVGMGKKEQKTFGFASCERLPHAAEGVLVLVEDGGKQRLSNIEYTDFKNFGIDDQLYPANTNILYANLQKILPVIRKNPLPGLMLNMKNKEPFHCPAGKKREVMGGRLESMMQNISDALSSPPDEPLETFLTYNERRKTISTAKKSFEECGKLLETPEGAFYDLLYNAHDLFKNVCGGTLDPFCTEEVYLKEGPSHHILYHPALGPLYSLIAQKVKSPTLACWSEMQLEIADLLLHDLKLDGSCLILAKNCLGHHSQGIIRYSQMTGKCILKNVSIHNKGVNRKESRSYWKNQMRRHEAFTLVLQGHSEFYAENVTFSGNQKIVVPDGERWTAYQTGTGQVAFRVEKPSWKWEYFEENKEIQLKLSL